MATVHVPVIPKEGEELHIMTSKQPEVNDQIEVIRGNKAVAIAIVVELNGQHAYTALVVASEAGPQ